mgnify:CR=1 FL=1
MNELKKYSIFEYSEKDNQFSVTFGDDKDHVEALYMSYPKSLFDFELVNSIFAFFGKTQFRKIAINRNAKSVISLLRVGGSFSAVTTDDAKVVFVAMQKNATEREWTMTFEGGNLLTHLEQAMIKYNIFKTGALYEVESPVVVAKPVVNKVVESKPAPVTKVEKKKKEAKPKPVEPAPVIKEEPKAVVDDTPKKKKGKKEAKEKEVVAVPAMEIKSEPVEKKVKKEKKKVEKKKKIVSEAPRLPSIFTGSVSAFIWLHIWTFFVSLITLGIAYPFLLAYKMRWVNKHTYIDDKRLEFTGRGRDLLGRWILWSVMMLGTLFVYSFVVALHTKRWKAQHTHFGQP